ncbi:hypothetical protein NDU88_006129 [Pleurodeles waltl]|uniref:Uncharacterized protein n=1 Tax=Pleurodeles waltl TaxID=8319 RepID=A0AAV7TWB6_PLEWA|nr:hypothetical protein NDU88_006129 [Pleurodeles waltl]
MSGSPRLRLLAGETCDAAGGGSGGVEPLGFGPRAAPGGRPDCGSCCLWIGARPGSLGAGGVTEVRL